jgi:formylglycine-generating enzyme required for sulfatase activity
MLAIMASAGLTWSASTVLAQDSSAPTTVQPGAEGEVVTNSIGLKLKLIPAGSFQMGSPDSEEDHSANEGPVHKVTISKPFYLGVYEVTQEQWEKVMASNPSSRKGANQPVTDVSWNDAQEFIRKLSEQEKVEYRLPTEAEWEYACRAGTKTAYYWGDGFDAGYSWARQNSGGAAHDVGTLKPNTWGLFDMSGNVWEWCEDRYGTYAGAGEQTDPKGASSGESRVLRGGSWGSFTKNSRAACRDHSAPPTTRDSHLGFRLARTK